MRSTDTHTAKRYKLVVFDWEGTLGDTLGQVLHAVAFNVAQLDLGAWDETLARRWVHLGLMNMIKKMFPLTPKDVQAQLMHAVQNSLMSCSKEVYLFTGARALIEKLHEKGIKLAIATNRGQKSLQCALQKSNLEAFFAVTRSAGQTLPKPATQMLEEILTSCGVAVDDALMIGDSESDMVMAKKMGMDVIGVNFYQQDEQLLRDAGALEVFDTYQAVANYLQVLLR